MWRQDQGPNTAWLRMAAIYTWLEECKTVRRRQMRSIVLILTKASGESSIRRESHCPIWTHLVVFFQVKRYFWSVVTTRVNVIFWIASIVSTVRVKKYSCFTKIRWIMPHQNQGQIAQLPKSMERFMFLEERHKILGLMISGHSILKEKVGKVWRMKKVTDRLWGVDTLWTAIKETFMFLEEFTRLHGNLMTFTFIARRYEVGWFRQILGGRWRLILQGESSQKSQKAIRMPRLWADSHQWKNKILCSIRFWTLIGAGLEAAVPQKTKLQPTWCQILHERRQKLK